MRRRTIWFTWKDFGCIRLPIRAVKMEIPANMPEPTLGAVARLRSVVSLPVSRSDSQASLADVLELLLRCEARRPRSTRCHPDPAHAILQLLTSSAYRKGSLQRMQFDLCQTGILAVLRASIARSQPVQLTLMAFPFKVPNPLKVGTRRLPDVAELASVLKLRRLSKEIKAVYAPGLEIHLIHDGAYIADVFGVSLGEVRRYEAYFSALIRAVGANAFIHTYDFIELLNQCGCDLGWAMQSAWQITREWWRRHRYTPEWNDCFAKTLGMLNLRGWPTAVLGEVMSQARSGRLDPKHCTLQRSVRRAMLAYHARDTLLHMFDPRPSCFPNGIHATTRERPQRLALWLVRRGNSLLPWHGVGVLDRGGVSVRLARDVMDDPAFRPVYLKSESTPFLYQRVGAARKAPTACPDAILQEHSVCYR